MIEARIDTRSRSSFSEHGSSFFAASRMNQGLTVGNSDYSLGVCNGVDLDACAEQEIPCLNTCPRWEV